FGYFIGYYFFEAIGKPIISFYNLWEEYSKVASFYEKNSLLIVFTGAFTPVPYKVITITAGLFKINLIEFVLVSFLGRGGRFFLVALLLRLFGNPIRSFLDRYFNILTLLFVLLLIAGFLVIKLV
ncbi:MAG: VTT domain-containing protein, partial [bacterium]|nr:VTT domain-containing protein [bacterium]